MPEAALAALASRQHGVVSRAQLDELGFSRHAVRRRLQSDRLRRLHPGVYAVGHWALTPEAGITIHRTRVLHPTERIDIDGIPTTSPSRTLIDLADVLTDRRLAAAVNEAEVQRVFDLAAIEATLARLPGRTGAARLQRVLAAYTEPLGYSTSEAERLLLRVCKRHGLPQPQRIALLGYELDFYWADARVAIEVDGGRFHRTRRAFHEDRRRDRRLAAGGIQVARVAWLDLTEEAAEVAADLSAIRRQRM